MRHDASYGMPQFADELAAHSLAAETTLGQSGNFVLHSTGGDTRLMAVSSSRMLLRGAGTTQEQIERTAWLFGVSTTGLNTLASNATTPTLKATFEQFA